jgi:hypothetical protein
MTLPLGTPMEPDAGADDTDGSRGHATLILDRLGRILSCGEPAARLLGTRPGRLMGNWISEFIAGLYRPGSSPSYSARYLVHLCADGGWRRFHAVDGRGEELLVEISLAPMASNRSACEVFLLNLRRVE